MNAKEEFLDHVIDTNRNYSNKVICVEINCDDHVIQNFDDDVKDFYLTTGWSKDEWDKFLSDINFEYDDGYGCQKLFGTIWYSDGTWSDRGEYDGSEWWGYNRCPEIPAKLNRLDKIRDEKLNQIL